MMTFAIAHAITQFTHYGDFVYVYTFLEKIYDLSRKVASRVKERI